MRTIILGSTVIDFPMIVGHDPEDGETIRAAESVMRVAGKGLNQALQLYNLGIDVRFITALGNDSLGHFALDHINKLGLSVSTIARRGATSYAVPIGLPHKHFIFHVPGINADITPADLDALNIDWKWADLLVLQGEWPWAVSLWAAKQHARFNRQTVLNPAPADGFPKALLALTTTLISNQQELSTILGTLEPNWKAAMAQLFAANPRLDVCVATLGERGLRYFSRNGTDRTFSALPTTVVDPTGAGDSVLGAWLWAVAKGKSYEEAAQISLRAGALTVSRLGAGANLPTLADFEE